MTFGGARYHAAAQGDMAEVSSSVEIRSGPEAVWKLLCEPERYPDYVTVTQRLLDASDEPFGVGSWYREYGGIPPFVGESHWEVTEFEPTRHQRHIGDDGKMRMPLDLDVRSLDEQTTRLTITFGLKPRWYLVVPNAILWPLMMRRRAQRVLDDTAANVRRIVESEAASLSG